MTEQTPWQQWVYSTANPVVITKYRAKVDVRDGRKWIAYNDVLSDKRGRETKVIVEMPIDALTKSCDQGRHDDCAHGLGRRAEGGIYLKLSKPTFLWRCGCRCHREEFGGGQLFAAQRSGPSRPRGGGVRIMRSRQVVTAAEQQPLFDLDERP
ncbi:Uncharacterised protein [Mycobacteroides abscessus subsp. abscessus]|uniref:hypothetical protein n=1 Tax=Mycobacteroides abscessus TaxID=36809 RepID=UPI0009277D73|nr:hypothetical protein [Mycobacteroides abscessus]SHY53743.1 Uncharacterised protein [Mycobacteroides abscessus subsp. abscessus]